MSADRDSREDRADDDEDEADEGGGWSNVSVRRKNGREEQRRTHGSLGCRLQHTPKYTLASCAESSELLE